MTKPVEVTKEVFKVLLDSFREGNSEAQNVSNVMFTIEEHFSVDEFFELNNLTVSDILMAHRHGYEVPYEFKVGDIVASLNHYIFEVVDDNQFLLPGAIHVGHVNSRKERFIIICKAENREGTKQ